MLKKKKLKVLIIVYNSVKSKRILFILFKTKNIAFSKMIKYNNSAIIIPKCTVKT